MPFPFAANNFQVDLVLEGEVVEGGPPSAAGAGGEPGSTANSRRVRNWVIVGGVLKGRLEIRCTAPTAIRALVLKHTIEVGWHLGRHRHGQGAVNSGTLVKGAGGRYYESVPYHLLAMHRTIYAMEIVLVGSRHGQGVDIPVGNYCYPFVVPVPAAAPPTCPTSFVGTTGGALSVGSPLYLGVSHFLCAEVIIAFGFKDYSRFWEVEVRKPGHPATVSSQEPETRYNEAPLYTFGLCCPSLVAQLPFMFRTAHSRFQVTVINPIISLDAPPEQKILQVKVRVRNVHRPLILHFCRRTVVGSSFIGETTTLEQIITSVPLLSQQRGLGGRRASLTQVHSAGGVQQSTSQQQAPPAEGAPPQQLAGVVPDGASPWDDDGDNMEPYDILVRIPITFQPGVHPVTLSLPNLTLGYDVVVRSVTDETCGDSVLFVGGAQEDEARVPVVISHCLDERAPMVSALMSWLPSSQSTLHAAPEWISGEVSNSVVAAERGGAPTHSPREEDPRSEGVDRDQRRNPPPPPAATAAPPPPADARQDFVYPRKPPPAAIKSQPQANPFPLPPPRPGPGPSSSNGASTLSFQVASSERAESSHVAFSTTAQPPTARTNMS